MKLKLEQLAALADCIESVDMARVYYYRERLRSGLPIPSIRVCSQNRQGYYTINDGNHRALAHALEGYKEIHAEIDPSAKIADLSWRWPRVAPLKQTLDLIMLEYHDPPLSR